MQGKQNRTAHKPDRLVDVVGRVPGEGVVQVPDEIVLVLVLEGHERAAHHDELDLVHRVAELAELVHAILRLQVRVVSANLELGGNWQSRLSPESSFRPYTNLHSTLKTELKV